MQIDFAHQPPSRVGIEWELACVDRGSGELAGVAPEILRSFPHDDAHPHVTGEFLTNTVEVVSAPHSRVGHAVDDLARLIERGVDVADPLGIDLMCAGTHPFSAWPDQDVTPDNERYATLLDRTRWWGRQMMIWGVHVHVGIDDASKALSILNALLVHLPRFQALSASSPFWSGQETGYASNRALMFQQLPTAGLPPDLTTWADYERLVGDMTHVGVIDHHSELRWDIRPAPKWGTLETRVFDGVSTLGEIASLAALVQCLVHDMSAALDRGEELPRMQPWFVRENKWRAARYGMDAHHPGRRRRRGARGRRHPGPRGPPLLHGGCARLRGGAARDPRHRRPRRELPAAAAGGRGERRRARARGHAPRRGAALRIGPVTRGRLCR